MKGSKISPRKYFRQMLYNQRSRSKHRGHPPPSYTLDELITWLEKQPCLTQFWENWIASGCVKALAPSIDRKDDNLPYTLDNIQLMTWEQNHRKGSEDIRSRKNKTHRHRSVVCFDLEGNKVKSYPSLTAASEDTGVSIGNIGNTLSGKQKTCCGMTWKYEDQINVKS